MYKTSQVYQRRAIPRLPRLLWEKPANCNNWSEQLNYIVTIFEQFYFWYHVFVLVKLASSPSRLVMCLVCYCVPVPIYIYCCNYQKTEFISDHQKILSLAVDASPGYHISGDEGKVWTAHGNSRLSQRVWHWPRWLVNLLGACRGVLRCKRHWRQSSQETCDSPSQLLWNGDVPSLPCQNQSQSFPSPADEGVRNTGAVSEATPEHHSTLR